MGSPTIQTVKFNTAQISDAFTGGNQTIQTIVVPASFGATSLQLWGSDAQNGTFTQILLVAADMTVTDFIFDISPTVGKRYSVTGSFPAGTEWLQLVAVGASVISKEVKIESKSV